MSIAIKVPSLPHAAHEARVRHWYKSVNEVIARGEVLVELLVRDTVLPILAPQAGLVERIFFPEGETVNVAAVIALLKSGLPNLRWDPEQSTLILETYRAQTVTTSMEYELRQMLRQGEAKFGKGFGSGLALPQIRNTQPEHGMGMGEQAYPQFKSHPLLAPKSQHAGDVKANPVTPEQAQHNPQYKPNLSLTSTPQLGPSAPTYTRH